MGLLISATDQEGVDAAVSLNRDSSAFIGCKTVFYD